MISSPKAAAKALLKRRTAAIAKPLDLDPNFPAQNAFIEDPARFIAAQCSRRAGKTNGLAIRFFKTLEKHPKSQCVYLGLTFESARDIMWPVLHDINDQYRLGCTFLESKLIMTHPNGAKLRIMGADMKNFIKRLKGRKFPGVAIDEAQDFGSHLESLIDDVLTPSIADYKDGWVAMTGTPGPVPHGYFFEVTNNGKYGYSPHGWTLLDNPHMPDPAKFIAETKAKRQWDDNHPTYLREYCNKWVLDVQSLWVQYKDRINHYDALPSDKEWHYIMGIDIGFNDADAIAVLAWSNDSPKTYLVHETVTKHQGLTELVEQVQDLMKVYDPDQMVIDEGGLGKKLAEEMRRRYGIPVQGAEKQRKQETVTFLNDSLRMGNFMAKSSSRFAQDSYLVQIDWDRSTPDRIVVKKKPHSDIIDAVIYAYKLSPAYTYEAPKVVLASGSDAWAKQQEAEMFEAAQAHFAEMAENERRSNSNGYED